MVNQKKGLNIQNYWIKGEVLMEALLILDCSQYSQSVIEILKKFQQIGWGLYNSQEKIEYLPLGDNDDYDWQCKKMSMNQFYNIVEKKIDCGEIVGINLYYRDGKEGVSLLAHNTRQIMLNISINRKTIDENHTDMSWYINNIIYQLFKVDVKILSYKVEEFED